MGTKVNIPTGTNPVSIDWQNFIAWVEKAQVGKINITFLNMDNTSEPKIQAGSIVEIAGSLYSFSAEEAATGWAAIADNTQAYMRLVVSGDTVSAEWTTTAPTYRDDLQGWYESGTIKRYILASYKDGTGNYTEKTKIKNVYYGDNTYLGNNSVTISGGERIQTNDLYLEPTGDIKNSFASPSGSPTGLTYDTLTGNLISCDRLENKIYIHNGVSSTILSSFASPAGDILGLTYDTSTGNLISCDVGTDLIYIHDGISSTILSSFASFASVPSGLGYDSSTGNLISCDDSTDLIYIHDGISSTLLFSFSSPGTEPLGVSYSTSTGNLISADSNDQRIYIHDGISSTILSSFAAPGSSTYAIAYDSSIGNLISCDRAIDFIYIYSSKLKV